MDLKSAELLSVESTAMKTFQLTVETWIWTRTSGLKRRSTSWSNIWCVKSGGKEEEEEEEEEEEGEWKIKDIISAAFTAIFSSVDSEFGRTESSTRCFLVTTLSSIFKYLKHFTAQNVRDARHFTAQTIWDMGRVTAGK